MSAAAIRYFEDYEIGQTFETESIEVTAAAIERFATEYDPQVYHRADAAAGTMFGRLIASGWQTAAYTMRMIVDSGAFPPSGAVGAGVDELRWLKPVYPGDTLHVVVRVESLKAKPGKTHGFVRFRVLTRNQQGEDVMTEWTTALVERREPSPAVAE